MSYRRWKLLCTFMIEVIRYIQRSSGPVDKIRLEGLIGGLEWHMENETKD